MRKLLTLIIILVGCLLVFSGCTPQDNDVNPNDGEDTVEEPNSEVDYEIIEDIGTIDQDFNQYIENIKLERGFTNLRNEEKEYNLLVVTSGEKTTAGYDINVKSSEMIEGVVNVTVEEISPEEGAMTAEVLTYPMVILDFPLEYNSFKVITEDEEELIYIPPNRINIEATGIYVGQIDNNFVEIKVDNEPKSFMITDEVRESIEALNENSTIDFSYYINENEQYAITEIYNQENDGKTIQRAEGVYEGRIDNFSIEIIVEKKPMAFMNYEMDKLLEGIENGDEVEIEYTKNEHGQLELKSIKKID